MAKLNIKIHSPKDGSGHIMTITFSNEFDVDDITEPLKDLFEIELYGAEIVRGEKETTVTFKTTSDEKIDFFKKECTKVAMKSFGMPPINLN